VSAVVELARPRRLIPRWPGHGDLHLLVDDPVVYLRSADVERLAGIPPWGRGETLLLDDEALVLIDTVPYYTLAVAVGRAEYEDTVLAGEFVAWLDEQLPLLLDPAELERAHRVPGFAGAHTVTAAAKILARDLGLRLGRDRLFEHLAGLGWITRAGVDEDWDVTSLAHDRDWLTRRPVAIPAPTRDRRRQYLQVHVTERGLAQLRTALAVGRPEPPPPEPTLFD
jgi:hypothetical protein